VAGFTRNLATLLAAGVPLVRALAVARQHSENVEFGEAIDDIIQKMRAGEAFSSALSGHEGAFSGMYVSIVSAGETAGALPEALKRLAFFLEREAKLRSDVLTAMTYPALVLVLGLVFIGVIIGFVLPRILSRISSFTTVLPWPTRVLMACSDGLRQHWLLVLAAIVTGIMLLRWVSRTAGGRLRIDSFKLRLPIAGSAFRRVAVGRFARTLGVLARNGVPILESLAIAGQTTGNARIARAVDSVARNVKGGQSLANELARTNEFPALLVNMAAVGEETGRLDMVLLEAAEAYDQDVAVAIDRLNALLPPVLIIIVGAVIGFAVAGVILPIVQLQDIAALR